MSRSSLHLGRRTALLLCAVLAAAFAQSATSQQRNASGQSQTVLRATTELVVVDVIVTGKDGAAVADLAQDDFTVLEDGQPQRLSGFRLVRPAVKASAPPRLAPNVVTNAPHFSEATSWNIILLDAINTEFSSRAYAHQMLIKYLESGPAVQPTAVYGLEQRLVLLHDFTTDTKVLAEAITHYSPGGPEHLPTVEAAASPFGRRGSFKAGPRAREVTLNEMLFLADALAGYPGRKNLIWLSEGFPMNLYPDALTGAGGDISEDYSAMVQQIADAMMRAEVAVYPIDAAGVTVNDRFDALTTMQSISERTGGKTFFYRNDLEVGIRTSIDDGSTYYTMDYYPSNRNWNGKFRRIEVKVNRPGVQLQYRRGYYGLSPNDPGREPSGDVAKTFSNALSLTAPPSTGVLFQAAVIAPSDKSQHRYVVAFGIDAHTLAFERQADGKQHASLLCVVWAYPRKGEPIRAEGGTINADFTPEVYAQVLKSYLPVQRPIDLPRGEYTLRLGVLDRSTNLIGTTSTKVVVP